jgi:DinB superfamily
VNKEIQYINTLLKELIKGEPWYGRSAYAILAEVDEQKAFRRPKENTHSFIELLFHMIAWASFTEKWLDQDQAMDPASFDRMDWIAINPSVHSWENGLDQFKFVFKRLIILLEKKDDSLLEERVQFRQFNFRFLLHGLIQHTVYHLGQIAYLNKLLD